MPEFFKLFSLGKLGTPYAQTIISDNDVFFTDCPECERNRFNEDNEDLSLIIIQGKRKLPDYLLCGHWPIKIVSQRVIDAWQKHGVTGYTSFPIQKLLDKKMEQVHHDVQYHVVKVTGRVELDFEKMGVRIVEQCDTCGVVRYDKDLWCWKFKFFKDYTYDGSDLFAAKHFEYTPYCTKKILEITHREKFTNFGFRLQTPTATLSNPSPDIDLKELFRKKK